jgi:hypothetical protein
MNQHFYNGFIKRAQDYGLTVVEASNLYKVAGPRRPLPTPTPTPKLTVPTPATQMPAAVKPTPAPKIDPKKQKGTTVSPVPYERDTILTTPPATKEERDRIIKQFQSMGLNIKIEE